MIAELTAEEIVTNLLSSHEIIKHNKNNFYISDTNNLGEFLKNLPAEKIEQNFESLKDSKYTFIKNNGWKY